MRMRVAPSVRERETPLRSPLGLPALDLLIKLLYYPERTPFLIKPNSVSYFIGRVDYLPLLLISHKANRSSYFLISYLTHTVTLAGISLD